MIELTQTSWPAEVPAIHEHHPLRTFRIENMDGRDKPGRDEWDICFLEEVADSKS